MQDNYNGNSMLANGDPRSRSPDRFANIRAAEERKLLARNNGHKPKKIIMEQTNIPIPEDDAEEGDKFSGRESGGAASTPVDADNTDATLLKKADSEEKQRGVVKRMLDRVYSRYDVSQKSRAPFLLLSALCLLFFIIALLLLIIWPYIPSYLRADVCTDPECFDVSKQVSWDIITFLLSCFLYAYENDAASWDYVWRGEDVIMLWRWRDERQHWIC